MNKENIFVSGKKSKKYLFRRKMQIWAGKILGNRNITRIYYRLVLHRNLHLNNPQTFSEKVCWYKLNECPNNPLIIKCTDKYRARDYIREKGYGDLLPKLIGVWKSADEICFEDLPNRFALKCNHGSAYNIICNDKSKMNFEDAKKLLSKWMKEDFGLYNAEPHYDKIEKAIICEEYLDTQKGFLPIDYKIHCFNGSPRFVMECYDRDSKVVKFFYDLNRNMRDYGIPGTMNNTPQISQECLDKMAEISKNIARDFSFVRVDFYLLNGNPVIGEISFTPAAGLIDSVSYKGDVEIGKMWNINKK